MKVSDRRGYPLRITAMTPAASGPSIRFPCRLIAGRACLRAPFEPGGRGIDATRGSRRERRMLTSSASTCAVAVVRQAAFAAPGRKALRRMERSLFRYILQHTWRNQVLLLIVTAFSFPLIYINLAIPKEIVNNAISGKHIPKTVLGFEVTQISYLMALSFLLLALITLNGVIKYWLNVYSGVIGERALRRLRHDLYQQVLRFPLPQFKTMSSGEIIPMIVAETDPIGGFIGESISLPAFQGGLLATYMIFIFLQDFWLGLAAVALYPPQVWLIPRLQKKINQLSKERVQQARALSDRIGETVAGAAEIRGNDTFHRERADISERLGKIYAIRFDVFKRKFFVKFLNNFLGQITPFFFYSVGGYLVIKGSLSLGALVAVLAAYKDILAPWKELLTWYSTKEDVRIKYEQIVSQFEPPGLVDAQADGRAAGARRRRSRGRSRSPPSRTRKRAAPTASIGCRSPFPPASMRRSSAEGTAARTTSRISSRVWSFPAAGASRWRETISPRCTRRCRDDASPTPPRTPTSSRDRFRTTSTTASCTSRCGRRRYDEAGAKREETRVRDALIAGNSPDDVRADWIDYEAAGVADAAALTEAALVGAAARGDGAGGHRFRPRERLPIRRAQPSVATMGLEARARIRDRVQGEGSGVVRRAVRSRRATTRTSASRKTCCSARRAAPRSSRPTCPAIRSSSRCCATSGCWTTSTPRA